jgi:hypothetical protein
LVCIGLDGCDILHVSCSVSSNDGHTLLRLRKGYIGFHKKIGGGMAAPLPHACIDTPPK